MTKPFALFLQPAIRLVWMTFLVVASLLSRLLELVVGSWHLRFQSFQQVRDLWPRLCHSITKLIAPRDKEQQTTLLALLF